MNYLEFLNHYSSNDLEERFLTPDYSNAVEIFATDANYTVPEDGYIVSLYYHSSLAIAPKVNSGVSININELTVSHDVFNINADSHLSLTSPLFPVKEGDKIVFTIYNPEPDTSAEKRRMAWFLPIRK